MELCRNDLFGSVHEGLRSRRCDRLSERFRTQNQVARVWLVRARRRFTTVGRTCGATVSTTCGRSQPGRNDITGRSQVFVISQGFINGLFALH